MNIRKPEWLKIKVYSSQELQKVEKIIQYNSLKTVCSAAKCPNRGECYNNRTATFIVLGNICSRNCAFCNIESGTPLEIDLLEPKRVAKAVDEMNLDYVVITSVTRDDLLDGGAKHFSDIVTELRKIPRKISIELLIPDFLGDFSSLDKVIESKPSVLNHNMETVERLYHKVRSGANYRRSLNILKYINENSNIITKTGIILGMGERDDEVLNLLRDILICNCRIITIGQYLSPSCNHIPVDRWITPREFDKWKEIAISMGFSAVFSGPLVRSSYRAAELIKNLKE